MDWLSALLILLSLAFVGLVFSMNFMNAAIQDTKEPFEDTQQQQQQDSPFAPKIKAILDAMATPYANELCDVFKTIRDTMKKNIQAESKMSDAEAINKVDADLNTKIPGGALSCPLLKYPRAGATDLDWLHWLQNVPKDFGARVVLMADYANTFLLESKKGLEDALNAPREGFQEICTPDVAETRRMEKAKASKTSSCILPEEADKKTIAEEIDLLLQQLVATKTSILKAKSINPTQDIGPWVASAKQSAAWLQQKKQQAESGTLF